MFTERKWNCLSEEKALLTTQFSVNESSSFSPSQFFYQLHFRHIDPSSIVIKHEHSFRDASSENVSFLYGPKSRRQIKTNMKFTSFISLAALRL